VGAQNAAHHILIDFDAECQRDLLGNPGTAKTGIPLLGGNDGVDEFSVRTLGAGLTRSRMREQHPVLSFRQDIVQVQQGGGPQADGGTEYARWAHEEGAQAGDDPIRGTQVGSPFAAAIEDQQLVPDQHRFGHDGPESTWPCQPRQGDDQMNEQDDAVAHSGNRNRTSQTTVFRPIWQFAMDRKLNIQIWDFAVKPAK
jgi:hypothetical protein